MNHEKAVARRRLRRRKRVRKKVVGSQERPRLAVFRSHKHVYVQVIDDSSGKTLASASSKDKEVGGGYGGNITSAAAVGKAIAERATAAGITQVAFDRSGYKYHGRIAALAQAAREGGLSF